MNISLDQWRAVIGLFNALRLNDFRPIFNLSMIFWVLLFLAFIYKLKMACRECCIRLHSFLRVNINSSFFMTVLLLLLLQDCEMYTNQRVKFFRSTRFVHPLSIDKVLFGDSNISIEENISLFKAVHQYIKDTSRFSAN